MFFATKHSKARAAVTRLLIDPASADFSALRSVQDDGTAYVCGTVRARDKSGRYAEYRDFVYAVAVDLASIDDNGRIAHRHRAFTKCPISEEEDVALRKTPTTLDTASMAKTIQTILPTADPSILSTMMPDISAGGAKSSGGNLEQQTRQMASQLGGQPGRAGEQRANSTFNRVSVPPMRVLQLMRSKKPAARCSQSIRKTRHIRKRGLPSCGYEKSIATGPLNAHLQSIVRCGPTGDLLLGAIH